jgi:hypothetical protein
MICLCGFQGAGWECALIVLESKGKNMSFVGKVANGAIVIPPGVNLPEGTPVRVEPVQEETLAKRLENVIGSVEALPPDFAENHDRYIHGTPKK